MNLGMFASLVEPVRRRPRLAVLALAALVLGGVTWLRGPEYDEGYTVFISAGQRLPAWPASFRAGEVRGFYAGHSTAAGIARDLRDDDVHPPLYFWAVAAWRALAGTSLAATRALSVLLGLAGLWLVGVLARQTGLPAAAAMLLTLGCYGFAYTSAIARDFALAQLLCLAGLTLVVAAERRGDRWRAAAAGLAFGAAAFANYLALFVGLACGLWLLRRWRLALSAAAGGLVWLPAVGWFALGQLGSRPSQFPPFATLPALLRLLRYQVAAVFGGLPLYAGPAATVVVGAVVLVLVVALARRWRGIAHRRLLAMVAVAPAVGLVALGLLSGRAPIELRYLVFGLPAIGLLMAAATERRPWLRGLVLGVQTAAIAGLMLRAETMQPQGAAAIAAARLPPDALVLIPRGNDGVGVAGAFIAAAPDRLRLRLVGARDTAASLREAVAAETLVAAALLGLDDDSRGELAVMRAAFADPCWRPLGQADLVPVWQHVCPPPQGQRLRLWTPLGTSPQTPFV